MGTNYYLFRKITLTDTEYTPLTLGCGESSRFKVLDDGYEYNGLYYSTLDELNKDIYQKIHIGKSSSGWYFSLAIYPEYNINNLEDWIKLFNEKYAIIMDENEEPITKEDMIARIVNRKAHDYLPTDTDETYQKRVFEQLNKWYSGRHKSYKELLDDNSAINGVYGLWKHKPDKYTINTNGTYDYIISGNDPNTGCIFS